MLRLRHVSDFVDAGRISAFGEAGQLLSAKGQANRKLERPLILRGCFPPTAHPPSLAYAARNLHTASVSSIKQRTPVLALC